VSRWPQSSNGCAAARVAHPAGRVVQAPGDGLRLGVSVGEKQGLRWVSCTYTDAYTDGAARAAAERRRT
jgi:hypothetical protein